MSKLEEICARWEKATPGPWRIVTTDEDVGELEIHAPSIEERPGWAAPVAAGYRDDIPQDVLNAVAIARTPEDIDYLLRIAEAAAAEHLPEHCEDDCPIQLALQGVQAS